METSETVDVLAFGAHPDDVEIWCGGLMLSLRDQGYRLAIVDLTRGEMSTKGDVESRKHESETAAEILGATRVSMDFEDGFLTCNRREKERAAEVIRRFRPKIVLLPHEEDYHPDHCCASRIAYEGAMLASREKFRTDQPAWAVQKMIYYMSHHTFSPSFIVDVTDIWEEKIELVKSYRSQFSDSKDDDERLTNLSSDGWFDRFRARHLQYGREIHVQYGEPYQVSGSVPVDDPVELFTPETPRDYIPPTSG